VTTVISVRNLCTWSKGAVANSWVKGTAVVKLTHCSTSTATTDLSDVWHGPNSANYAATLGLQLNHADLAALLVSQLLNCAQCILVTCSHDSDQPSASSKGSCTGSCPRCGVKSFEKHHTIAQ
jgi:hypothetical protein